MRPQPRQPQLSTTTADDTTSSPLPTAVILPCFHSVIVGDKNTVVVISHTCLIQQLTCMLTKMYIVTPCGSVSGKFSF